MNTEPSAILNNIIDLRRRRRLLQEELQELRQEQEDLQAILEEAKLATTHATLKKAQEFLTSATLEAFPSTLMIGPAWEGFEGSLEELAAGAALSTARLMLRRKKGYIYAPLGEMMGAADEFIEVTTYVRTRDLPQG